MHFPKIPLFESLCSVHSYPFCPLLNALLGRDFSYYCLSVADAAYLVGCLRLDAARAVLENELIRSIAMA